MWLRQATASVTSQSSRNSADPPAQVGQEPRQAGVVWIATGSTAQAGHDLPHGGGPLLLRAAHHGMGRAGRTCWSSRLSSTSEPWRRESRAERFIAVGTAMRGTTVAARETSSGVTVMRRP